MQLVDKYRPTTIEAFAGVDRPKKILAAFTAKPYTSAWLLVGPSGTGKTTMACHWCAAWWLIRLGASMARVRELLIPCL